MSSIKASSEAAAQKSVVKAPGNAPLMVQTAPAPAVNDAGGVTFDVPEDARSTVGNARGSSSSSGRERGSSSQEEDRTTTSRLMGSTLEMGAEDAKAARLRASGGVAQRKMKTVVQLWGETQRTLAYGNPQPRHSSGSSPQLQCCVLFFAFVGGIYLLQYLLRTMPHDCPMQLQQCLHLGTSARENVVCEVPAGLHDSVVYARRCSNGATGILFHCMDKRYDLCGRKPRELRWTWDDGIPVEDMPGSPEADTGQEATAQQIR
ncbi:unnamed protein product [Amoebophrya sp. A25]|nr:unnamed protein product [Amoebophrya sp. A25]|eukprot:GSA25T00015218001.1